MRIDKIEICNLASIEGEQTIDFTQEPLKSAGLFAITGNTGAGKSTILDAICLALYNRAPRLDKSESAKGDNGAPAITNPCYTLRRGTTSGYSKVTFSLNDDSQYVATWSVSLNRNKKFNTVVRSLVQLHPKHTTIAEGVKEVSKSVERIVKLDYDQFTRTVILAQNSFNNFLIAKSSDKSQLLEKITGTEIYAEISKRIYQKAKDAERECTGAEQRMEGLKQGQLVPEDLQRAQETLNLLNGQKTKYANELTRIDRQLEWYDQYNKAKADLDQKRLELQAVRQEDNAMADSRRRLERYDRLQPFANTYHAITRVEKERNNYKEQHSKNKEQADQAKHNAEEAQARLNEAQAQLRNAQQILAAQQPNIDRGRTLEGQLAATEGQLKTTSSELARHDETLAQRNDNQRTKTAELKDCEERLGKAKLTMQSMAQHRSMIGQIELIRTKLEKMNSMRLQIAAAEESISANDTKRQHWKEESLKLKDEAGTMQEELTRLRSNLSVHEQANLGIDSSQLQKKLNTLASHTLRSQNAIDLWKRIDAHYTEINNTANDLQQSKTANEQRKKDAERLNDKIQLLREHYEQAQNNYTLSQSKDFELLRQNLKEGTPCPLCGSSHHPLHADSGQHLHQLQEDIIEQYQKAQEDLQQATNQQAVLLNLYNVEKGRIAAQEQLLQRLNSEQDDNKKAWEAYADLDSSFALCDSSVNSYSRKVMLHQIYENSCKERDEVSRRLTEYNKHQDEINAINVKMQDLQTKIAENGRLQGEANTNCSVAESSIKTLQQEADSNRNQLTKETALIEPLITIDNWRDRWVNSYEALDHELQAVKEEWNTCTTTLQKEENSLFQLQQELNAITSSITDLQNMRQTLATKADGLRQDISQGREELKALFGENSVDQEAARLAQAVDTARSNVDTAQAELAKANEQYVSLDTSTKDLERQYHERDEELRKLRTEMDTNISRFNLNEQTTLQYFELDEYFQKPLDWANLRKEIDDVKARLNEANYKAEAATNAMQDIETSPDRPSENDPDASKAALTANKEETQQAAKENDDALRDTEFVIKAHDESVKNADKFAPALQQARDNYAAWHKLSNVLGSATGHTFREIAQCYTFESLVGYANRQLADLTPRYELRAKPGTLLLNVVDRYMFDQERSVNSLSGGESFIVSLSLALGLSSLSSNNLDIGSLFIDEGFGNLDTNNLNMVIDALSNLQHTQRRKVGIISHTEEIRSRISPKIQLESEPGGKSRITITD